MPSGRINYISSRIFENLIVYEFRRESALLCGFRCGEKKNLSVKRLFGSLLDFKAVF